MKNNFDLRKFLIENKLTRNSLTAAITENDDLISKIRSAVSGPEADTIFAAAQKEIDNGDAENMADALAIAADQYYEYYDSKGNEDGTEVAKYITRSLPQSKSNVQDFSKLKDIDYGVNEVNFSKKEIINNVSFPNGVTFEVGQYSNEFGMTVTSIEPVTEDEREEDEVVYIVMKDGDDGIRVPFNANGEQLEI